MILSLYTAIVVNCMSREIMNDIFKLRENTHCNLRHTLQVLLDPIHSVFKGSAPGLYLRSKIWEQLKILTLLLVLKKKLENGNLRIATVEYAKFTYPI